jgi:hypothetical protein
VDEVADFIGLVGAIIAPHAASAVRHDKCTVHTVSAAQAFNTAAYDAVRNVPKFCKITSGNGILTAYGNILNAVHESASFRFMVEGFFEIGICIHPHGELALRIGVAEVKEVVVIREHQNNSFVGSDAE